VLRVTLLRADSYQLGGGEAGGRRPARKKRGELKTFQVGARAKKTVDDVQSGFGANLRIKKTPQKPCGGPGDRWEGELRPKGAQ